MAWQTTLTTMVRAMIGDLTIPETYSDSRIQQILIVAAQFVITEVSLSTQYTIDLNCINITPDPTAPNSLDNSMIILMTLRAACFLDQANMIAKAGSAVRVSDARSSIDATPLVKAFDLIISKGMCKSYQEAKVAYLTGGLQSAGVGQAILGPFAIISTYGAPGYMYSPNSPIGRESF